MIAVSVSTQYFSSALTRENDLAGLGKHLFGRLASSGSNQKRNVSSHRSICDQWESFLSLGRVLIGTAENFPMRAAVPAGEREKEKESDAR